MTPLRPGVDPGRDPAAVLRGFVTARSRNVHRTTECVKYQHSVNVARQRGRTVHPPLWTTTGAARVNEKGICSHCWS